MEEINNNNNNNAEIADTVGNTKYDIGIDTLFFGTVNNMNKSSDPKKAQEALKVATKKVYDDVTKKSVGPHKTPVAGKKKPKTKPKQSALNKTVLVLCLVAILLLTNALYAVATNDSNFGILGFANFVTKVGPRIEKDNKTLAAVNELIEITRQSMLHKGLAQTDDQESIFIVLNNSVDDYKRCLKIDTPEEVYACKAILNEDEFTKLIRAIEYSDAEGNTRSYSSFEEYLKVNGFKNESEFEKASREAVYNSYKDGHMTKYFIEGIPYYGSYVPKGGHK